MIYMPNNMPKYDPGDIVGSYKKLWNFCYALSEQLMLLLNNLGVDNIPELESIYSRLEGAEGGYSELIQTADEIAAKVAGNEGAIAEVKLTAEGLSSRVQDTEKGVSQLQQTAEGIGSRVANHEGAISALQQTATGIQTQVGDMQGNLTTLQQSANGLASRVSDAEGAISSVQQTASGLVKRVSDAEGDISAVQQTASSLKSTVSDLNGKYTSIKQTVDSIDIEGEVNQIMQDGWGEINFVYRGNTNAGSITAYKTEMEIWANDSLTLTSAGDTTLTGNDSVTIECPNDDINIEGGDEGTKIWVSGTRYWTFGRTGIFYCNSSGKHLSEVALV